MKLWLKQTLICLLVILLTFGACVTFFVMQQTGQLLDDADTAARQSVQVFCEHLSTLDRTAAVSGAADDTTVRALIQYTFSSYAHLLQSATCAYSLTMDGAYLYNISAYDPMTLLPAGTDVITATRLLYAADEPVIVCVNNTTVLGQMVAVYLVQDVSAVFAQINTLVRNAQMALLSCMLLSGVLLPLTLRRTLRPLRRLSRVSEEISGGRYALRSRIDTRDEVGELSAAFDHMAETVEQKIHDLEDTAHRRELLLGALTHEMKTPMTAIIGFSDSLLSMPLSEEKRMEAAHEIHEAALRTERLSQKMMQLIAMTDCPVLVRRRLDASELLGQAESMLTEPARNKGVTLRVQADADALLGDGDLLLCLLTNLIDNAIKASPAGSTITVRAGADFLSVADEGCGIPADKVALVTEPFYRVDKARSRKMGGAGLGLSLCQMIAQAHGGALHIDSRVGSGTTIAMTWPEGDAHE